MKESIDDLTNQAIDLVLENDALHKRIVEPLKRKILPYVACEFLTNVSCLLFLSTLLDVCLFSGSPHRFFLLFISPIDGPQNSFGWWFIFFERIYLLFRGVFLQS